MFDHTGQSRFFPAKIPENNVFQPPQGIHKSPQGAYIAAQVTRKGTTPLKGPHQLSRPQPHVFTPHRGRTHTPKNAAQTVPPSATKLIPKPFNDEDYQELLAIRTIWDKTHGVQFRIGEFFGKVRLLSV